MGPRCTELHAAVPFLKKSHKSKLFKAWDNIRERKGDDNLANGILFFAECIGRGKMPKEQGEWVAKPSKWLATDVARLTGY